MMEGNGMKLLEGKLPNKGFFFLQMPQPPALNSSCNTLNSYARDKRCLLTSSLSWLPGASTWKPSVLAWL